MKKTRRCDKKCKRFVLSAAENWLAARLNKRQKDFYRKLKWVEGEIARLHAHRDFYASELGISLNPPTIPGARRKRRN